MFAAGCAGGAFAAGCAGTFATGCAGGAFATAGVSATGAPLLFCCGLFSSALVLGVVAARLKAPARVLSCSVLETTVGCAVLAAACRVDGVGAFASAAAGVGTAGLAVSAGCSKCGGASASCGVVAAAAAGVDTAGLAVFATCSTGGGASASCGAFAAAAAGVGTAGLAVSAGCSKCGGASASCGAVAAAAAGVGTAGLAVSAGCSKCGGASASCGVVAAAAAGVDTAGLAVFATCSTGGGASASCGAFAAAAGVGTAGLAVFAVCSTYAGNASAGKTAGTVMLSVVVTTSSGSSTFGLVLGITVFAGTALADDVGFTCMSCLLAAGVALGGGGRNFSTVGRTVPSADKASAAVPGTELELLAAVGVFNPLGLEVGRELSAVAVSGDATRCNLRLTDVGCLGGGVGIEEAVVLRENTAGEACLKHQTFTTVFCCHTQVPHWLKPNSEPTLMPFGSNSGHPTAVAGES